jgi:hypothetical protein
MKTKIELTRLRVFNPLRTVTLAAENATRLDTLQGKTICEVATTGAAYWRANVTFPIIRELIHKQFTDVKFVPYTEFPDGRSEKYPVPLGEIGELLRGKGCDAVLLGNGG